MALKLTTLSSTSFHGIQQRTFPEPAGNVAFCRTPAGRLHSHQVCTGTRRIGGILVVKKQRARPAAATSSSRNPHYVPSSKSDDDGGTTQITALLVLSLTLLSLPWAFEHPGLLLVPVAMSMLPGVGPAFVQPVLRQALSWLMAWLQWVPRVAKATVYRSKKQYVRISPQQHPGLKHRQEFRRPNTPAPEYPEHMPHRAHVHLMDNLEQL